MYISVLIFLDLIFLGFDNLAQIWDEMLYQS